jgi:hypothetical protein
MQGHKVKATIIFIGRMMVHQDIGRKLMDEILERLNVVGKVEQPPKMEGRYLTVMLIPDKKKIDDYKKTLDKTKPAGIKPAGANEVPAPETVAETEVKETE